MEWLIGKLIASPIIGTLLQSIGSTVLSWQKQKLDAEGTAQQHIDNIAQRSIELDRREAELNAAVVVAEQGNWVTRLVRPALALPVIVLMAKLIIWDKALGQWTAGSTDALDPHLWSYINTVVISYMGGRSAEKIAAKVAGIFKKNT